MTSIEFVINLLNFTISDCHVQKKQQTFQVTKKGPPYPGGPFVQQHAIVLLSDRVEGFLPGVFSDALHLVLDPHELIVFADAVGARHGAGLDLAGLASHDEVGDKGVLGLARAVGDDGGVIGLLGHVDGLDGLGDGADLVDLDQDRVAGAHADALLQALGIGDEEVVADDLYLVAEGLGHLDVAVPVILVQRILDRDDGILVDPLRVQLDHLLGGEEPVGIRLPELVALFLPLAEKLGGGAVQGDRHVVAGLVAGLLDGLHNVVEGFLVADVGGEAALVADRGDVTVGLEQRFEVVEDLGGHAHGLADGLGAHRHDHELLEVDLVVRMLPAVDDVGHGDGEQGGMRSAQVLVQRHAEELGGGAGAGHGDAEDGVGAELGLVLGPVEVDHGAVDVDLLERVETADLAGDGRVDVLDGLEHALSQVALFVAVAEFDRLVVAGRGPGGDGRASEGAVIENDIDLDCGIAAGIEDLARLDVFDNAHRILLD